VSVFSFLPDRRTVSCGIGRRIGCRWSLKNRSEIPASDTRWGAQIFNLTKTNRRFQFKSWRAHQLNFDPQNSIS